MLRWLAISGAGGAAIAAAFGYFYTDAEWQIVAFGFALLAIAGIFGLWRAFHVRNEALVEAVVETGDQKREVSVLQEELAVHKRLERELTEAKQAAEAAMMAKGEFLATMSHEIRTPLNGIIPMLDLLMTSRLAPDQQDILRTAYTSSRQMLRIVDDILDYSKLEANKLQLESTSFNLRELLDSVIRLMEKPAESKALRLNLQIDPGVRLAVRGDPVRLRQILTNLLSNALKFTERGSITLQVIRKGETRTQHELRFEVRDSGIGIAKENHQNLFRAFSQADASTTRLYGGTGLGLVICKRIVDLMGGTIGVESEAGRGSTFWFDIPMMKAAGDIQGQRTDLNGARILLLSTDAALRQRLLQAAPGWGAQLTEAETTQDALTRLRNSNSRGSNWSFDLLIVDLNSARATAIALHRNLSRSVELEDLHVVYLQGNEPAPAELSDNSTALILPRAVGQAELRTAISSYLSTPIRRNEPAPVPIPLPMAELPTGSDGAAPVKLRGHVLLVEDNPVNQMVAQRLLGMLGLQCETADNGEKAIDRMRVGGLDLILMDCQMPVKDGYTATTEWREYETGQGLPRIPIIAMTANAMAGDRQKCIDAGMDDYLSKPVDRRVLEATIGRWLQQAQGKSAATPAAAAPAISAVPAPTPAPAAPTPSAIPTPVPAPRPALQVVTPPPAAPSPRVMPETIIAPAPPRAVPPVAAPSQPPRPLPPPMPPRPMAPAAAMPPAATSAPALPTPAVLPVLAMEIVEELRAVMGPEYLVLIKLFLEDAPTHIQKLEAAAASNNVEAMVAPAHTLKSSSANLGALALSAVAKRIEIGARSEALPRPTVAVVMLENEFKRAQVALTALMKP
jgi:signal transduction histidine kinase/DNA-binding response OmpR family regulator/HPt (histidine-containing phosphotransfer) domain-containing protein